MRRDIIVTLLIVSVLISLFFIWTLTGSFENIFKNKLEQLINKNINGKIIISKLEGNIYSKIRLTDIYLKNNQNNVLEIKSILLDYNLLPIFSKRIQINSILIDSLEMQVRKGKKGLNLLEITKTKEATQPNRDEKEFSWDVSLKNLELINSQLNLVNILPKESTTAIRDINIKLGIHYIKNSFDLSLQRFSFNSKDINLLNTKLKMEKTENKLDLNDFKLELEKTNILIAGELKNNLNAGVIKAKFDPLALEELNFIAPQLEFRGKPQIDLKIAFDEKDLKPSIIINKDEIVITGNISNYKTNPAFSINGKTNQLNLNKFWETLKIDTSINSKFSVESRGIDLKNFKSKIHLRSSLWENYKINNMKVNIERQNNDFELYSDIDTDYGKLKLESELTQKGNIFEYDLTSDFQKINISKFISAHQSKINGNVKAKGFWQNQKNQQTSIKATFKESSIDDIPIDNMNLTTKIQNSQYDLRSFKLENQAFNLIINGNGNFESNHNFDFKIKPKKTNLLARKLGFSTLVVNGSIDGSLKIKKQAIALKTKAYLNNMKAEDMSVNKLVFKLDFAKKGNLLYGNSDLLLDDFSFNNHKIKKVLSNSSFNKKEIETDLKITQSDSLDFSISAKTTNYLKNKAIINKIQINLPTENWSNKTSAKFSFTPEEISLKDLYLESSKNAVIKIASDWKRNFFHNLNLELENFDLSSTNQFTPVKIAGNANLKINQKENSFRSDLFIDDFSINKVKIDSLRLKSQLNPDTLVIDSKLQKKSDILMIRGKLETSNYIPKKKGDHKISLNSHNFDLSFLNKISDRKYSFDGLLNSELEINNKSNNFEMYGQVDIDSISFKMPQYNLDFGNSSIKLRATEQKIDISSSIISKEDKLTISGNMKLKPNPLNGFDNLYLDISGKDFQLAQGDKLHINIDANLNVKTIKEELRVNGKLVFNNFSANIDKLRNKKPKQEISESLLLKSEEMKKLKAVLPQESQAPIRKNFALPENFKGKIIIDLGKNNWLKSDDVSLEFGGNIILNLENNKPRLYGKINVVRGYYKFYGKNFELRKGEIKFLGSNEINPLIYFEIEYKFRDLEEKRRKLIISLSDRLNNPKITFLLDDKEIDKEDAVAYLLFGKSSEELTSGQKTTLKKDKSNIELLGNLALNKLINNVTNQLERELNLDILEVNNNKDGNGSSLIIGKYISDKVFIHYQTNLSTSSISEIGSQKITIEYQLSDKVSIEATTGNYKTTGMDLFYKFKKPQKKDNEVER